MDEPEALGAIRARYPALSVREVWNLPPRAVVLVSTSPPVAEVGVYPRVTDGPLLRRMVG